MKISDDITSLPFIGKSYSEKLKKLEIQTIKNLLFHTPFRFEDYRLIKKFKELEIDETVTIEGTVNNATNTYTKNGRQMQIVTITDGEENLTLIWFNQPFIIKNFTIGENFKFSGKISWFSRKKAMISPNYEKSESSVHTSRIVPVYPETKGISSKWIRRRIDDIYKNNIQIKDNLTNKIKKEVDLIDLKNAIYKMHFPQNWEDIKIARKRLAFDELLYLAIENQKRINDWENNCFSEKIKISKNEINSFIKKLPFNLTQSQQNVINEIIDDIKNEKTMNRLLQGDVGSGKTAVAASFIFASFASGYQSAILAPTQILANQHYETLQNFFKDYNVKISLVTSQNKKDKIDKSDIFVGTHALLNKISLIENCMAVVIDEQHKFGVNQRALISNIKNKTGKVPHTLTMTATPIPRTIALALYSDLKISVLDELPKGRQKITTWVVPNEKRKKAYKWIDEQIEKEKVQIYIVCALIEESDKETTKSIRSAKTEFENIQKSFPQRKVGLLHGKLKNNEKDEVIKKFKDGEIDILVSTTVVEVGVDVKNANIIVIEDADRFGLSQLHQLRGRVGRGNKKAYCLLFSNSENEKSLERLEVLTKTHKGQDLAEMDLKHRGPGEIFGTQQHGAWKLKHATWEDIDLIKKAKQIAENIKN